MGVSLWLPVPTYLIGCLLLTWLPTFLQRLSVLTLPKTEHFYIHCTDKNLKTDNFIKRKDTCVSEFGVAFDLKAWDVWTLFWVWPCAFWGWSINYTVWLKGSKWSSMYNSVLILSIPAEGLGDEGEDNALIIELTVPEHDKWLVRIKPCVHFANAFASILWEEMLLICVHYMSSAQLAIIFVVNAGKLPHSHFGLPGDFCLLALIYLHYVEFLFLFKSGHALFSLNGLSAFAAISIFAY